MTRAEFNNLKPGDIVDDFFNGLYKVLSVNKMSGSETDIDAVQLAYDESTDSYIETESTVNWLKSDDIVNYMTK
jgi:hypothetical protein